jgi:hypothetical protein
MTITSTSTPISQGPAFYVSTTGSDSNSGRTVARPWQHIQTAANRVGPGSTVYVRGGVYHEQVTLPTSGNASRGVIQFQSFPGETAILDGTGVMIPTPINGPTGLFQITNRNYIIISGFEIRN